MDFTPLVLVVEDMEDLAFLLARDLRKAGFTVETVGTFRAAKERVQTPPYPNIILLDLELPDSPTHHTINAIPLLQKFAPVMVVSGQTAPEVIATIEAMGAVFHQKNGLPESFLVKIVKAIAAFRSSETAQLKANVAWLKNFLAEHGH